MYDREDDISARTHTRSYPVGSGAATVPFGSGADTVPYGSGADTVPIGSGADTVPIGSDFHTDVASPSNSRYVN